MQRKMRMRVSLPKDYVEKLYAQKIGTEESDMELPEVNDYKTRKLLGDEDIEQQVYGINPYTHNLLLDSTPKELDWPLLEKHLFIEDVLLCTLNKQIRNFAGTRSRNTPMMYSVQLVIEENEKLSRDRDIKAVKMCRGILKAIDSHPDDRYVAYRKVYTTFFFIFYKGIHIIILLHEHVLLERQRFDSLQEAMCFRLIMPFPFALVLPRFFNLIIHYYLAG